MVRSMYSGVSGLRTHQTRMDTIGNNIANVNTYGYKSTRTTFRDIYYQTLSAASGPTAAQGGTNPSQVGYGTQVGSIDLMMGRSTFSMTDQTMDLAIDGDGFFQVQDANGNMYYTRAGMLNFDSAGNLVDMQGNYVLGINGDPTGRAPGSERITVALPAVQPAPGTVSKEINGKGYTITATNNTKDGNINFNFTSDATLTDGVKAEAKISATGIIVTFNANETFGSWADVNTAVNDAILAANGGQEHVAGRFNITYTGDATKNPFLPANMPKDRSPSYLTGAELASTDYGVQYGSVNFASGTPFFGGVTPTGKVGSSFEGRGDLTAFRSTYDGSTSPAKWVFQLDIDDGNGNITTYEGEVDSTRTTPSKFNLYNTSPGADQNDYIEMNRPSFTSITAAWQQEKSANPVTGDAINQINVPDASAMTSSSIPFLNATQVELNGTPHTWGADALLFDATYNQGTPNTFTVTMDVNGTVYTGTVTEGVTNGTISLTNGSNTYEFTVPGDYYSAIMRTYRTDALTQNPVTTDAFMAKNNADLGGANAVAKASGPSYALGLSSQALTLKGGTEGGPQTIADMTGIAIGSGGMIIGLDSQGNEVIIGRIDLATFPNQSGLTQAGSTTYMESANSGAVQISTPGTNGAGQLVGGTLELSNVDLSREFSDMITTQRGYQANSRIITVSDTMLEELINLKR